MQDRKEICIFLKNQTYAAFLSLSRYRIAFTKKLIKEKNEALARCNIRQVHSQDNLQLNLVSRV